MSLGHLELVQGLRAAADPTRLRLLALLSVGEFAVSELTGILGQSQPRVSRHLRVMAEAGLLERFRERHWVFYRLAADGEGGDLARALLGRLDLNDAVVALDRVRAESTLARRAEVAAGADPSDAPDPIDGAELGRLTIAELGPGGVGALLYLGPAPTGMLQVLGPVARRVLGVSGSRLEVQRARASLHGRGMAHCALHEGDLRAATAGGGQFDLVVLDRSLLEQPRPERALAEAARVLLPGGRLALIEDYEALAARASVSHPLGILRDWISGSGLMCTRIRPVDMGTSHLLVAIAATEFEQAAA